MLRLDFYLQHLVRQNANGIDLISDEPVRFKLPEGDRESSKALDHTQIVQLVQEAAPAERFEALRVNGSTRFRHASEAGVEVEVDVQAHAPRAWRVRIRTDAAVADLDARPPRPPIAAAAPAAPPAVAAAPAAPLPPPNPASPPAPPPAAAATAFHSDSVAPPHVASVAGEPAINRLLRAMIALESSDLHLTSSVVPMIRRHGEMRPVPGERPLGAEELAEMIRAISPERNREEHAATNDTDFAHTVEGLARFRVNVFVDRFGVGAVLRQIPFEILSVEKLGIPPRVIGPSKCRPRSRWPVSDWASG
jgi:twitching motility protein PilT